MQIYHNAMQVLNVMNYDGDRSKFGLAEKFIWEVGQHSTFGLRLDVMCLQREVVDKVVERDS